MLRDARSYWKHDYENEFPSIIQSMFYLSNIMTRGVCRRLPKSLAELQRGAARPQAKHETAAGEVVCVCVCAWAAGQSWCGCIRDTAETLVLTNLIYEISDCAAELLTPFGSTPGCGGSTESSSKDSDSIRVTDPCELCLIFMHRCEPESLPNANGPCGVQHGKHHINIYARFNASWMRDAAERVCSRTSGILRAGDDSRECQTDELCSSF